MSVNFFNTRKVTEIINKVAIGNVVLNWSTSIGKSIVVELIFNKLLGSE